MIPLVRPIPKTGVEWLDENFYLAEGSSQIPGKWVTQPAQVFLANLMVNDHVREVYVQKSARVGYSKLLVGCKFFFAEHKKRSGVLYQPGAEFAKRFVNDEINPCFPVMPCIQRVFPEWNKPGHKNNTDKRKSYGGTIWHFSGASKNNFRSLTKQVVMADEIDSYKLDIDGEGSFLTLARRRLEGASFPKLIVGSTPTIKGVSNIEVCLGEADLVFRFMVPCPHCGALQELRWGGPDADFGIKWDDSKSTNEAKARTAFYKCRACEDPIYYRHLPEMERKGKWVAEDFTWSVDGRKFFNEDGNQVSAPANAGVLINALYSINLTYGWPGLVKEFLDSKGDPNKLKSFINTILGELWEDPNQHQLDWEILYNRREVYKAEVPRRAVYLTGGVDVQTDRVEGYIWGWGADEESWLIDSWAEMGNPAQRDVWDRVYKRLSRSYRHEGGIDLEISRVCMDTGGHHATQVHAFSKRHGLFKFLPIRGAPNDNNKPVANMPKKKGKRGTYFFEVGTTDAKDTIYGRYDISIKSLDEPNPGYVHLPLNENICSEEVVKQLVIEKKVLEYQRGVRTYRWKCPSGKSNEATDCFNYALAALRASKQRFGLKLEELSRAILSSPDVAPPVKRRKVRKPKVVGGL